MESFGKTRNKIIQKTPLPKIIASGERENDTEKDRQMSQDAIYEHVHHALINQSGLFMNTLRNVVRDAMSGSLMQEQTIGPAYFHTSPSATGTSK